MTATGFPNQPIAATGNPSQPITAASHSNQPIAAKPANRSHGQPKPANYTDALEDCWMLTSEHPVTKQHPKLVHPASPAP